MYDYIDTCSYISINNIPSLFNVKKWTYKTLWTDGSNHLQQKNTKPTHLFALKLHALA